MNITHIVFDKNSFGITLRSLKILRDTLAESAHHRIAVVEVPMNSLCCGYFIFDWEWQRATWTGDGFRTDLGGEGGAGYRSAVVLFELFRIAPIPWEPLELDILYSLPKQDIERQLFKTAQKIANELADGEFTRPVDKEPHYIR
jgi:hypothetical protein